MKLTVLLVDDEEVIQMGVAKHLSDHGYDVFSAFSLKEARSHIKKQPFDAILLDVRLSDGNSLDLIRDIRAREKETAVIMISGASDVATAVKAMKLGAENFITKPLEMDGLNISIQRNLELVKLRKKDTRVKRLEMAPLKPYFGNSSQIKTACDYSRIAAGNDAVVLLTGETGTGKGILAKWIHDHSRCKAGNFVELNCSSLKGELLRSELYGHAKGSFTSAVKDRAGLVEIANNGTLFLDEIGDMDLEVQAELLKTIEEKKFRRIGENVVRSSDFRLVCATNRDLMKMAEEGTFRSDLYYRICVFPIELPSLRERTGDIRGYAEHFLKAFGYDHMPLDEEVVEALSEYSWPGNIRELRNMLERALILSQGKALKLEHFPGLLPSESQNSREKPVWNLNEVGKRHIMRALEHFDDKLKASKALGITVSALDQKLEKDKQVAA
ncbi:MAG: sigma-54-dependent transcriptional regulator [Chitinispirillaceae bacterium]